eukprot:11156040-Lingulodinium_polyedra.AAC.1
MDGDHPAVAARRRRSNHQFARLMFGTTSGIHALKVGGDYIIGIASIDEVFGKYFLGGLQPTQRPAWGS